MNTRTLAGRVLRPGDNGYDQARMVWNAAVDRHPKLIVQCQTTSDVVAAVRTAREAGLRIGVRCGGHSVAGHAVPEDGLMIDLTPMGAVRVDPVRQRAWVQGGALLGALDEAAQRYGLATTAGNVSHTGVGGLTLGGGMGWLARQYGLACDNVISYQVVTADGDIVTASATERPDLYWGLRGGGGNFGIVTEFEFRLHRTGTQTLSVDLTFPIEQAERVLRGWRDLNATEPRHATFTAGFSGNETVRVGYVWVGDPVPGGELLPALRALGRTVTETVTEQSYLDLQRQDDTPQGHARRRYWKGHYLPELSDQAIDALIGSRTGVGVPNASLQAYGGAIADVPDEDSAFSHRTTQFEFVAATGWTDPAEDQSRAEAVRGLAAVLDPHASGMYANIVNDEGLSALRRTYSLPKLTRLTTLKTTYDPENTFRLNHNIPPASTSSTNTPARPTNAPARPTNAPARINP